VAYLPCCGIGLLRANQLGPYNSMLMSVLLISTFFFVQPSLTYGQSDPFSSLICASLPASGIAASGDDGVNVPSRAIDKNIDTRWSSLGLGSWIQLDLGQVNTICSVGINWHRGNERVNSLVISVSTDGNAFTNVFSGKSDGASLTEQNYNFQSMAGRFVRVTVTGNTQNNWVSIAELKIYGHKLFESDSCTKSPILEVTGPSVQSYPPSNVIDNNLGTVWSNYGIGSSIVLDLGASKSTCSVDIAWYKGNERQNNFVISTSLDGKSYRTVLTATSSGKTLSYENYVFSDNLARYIKITVNGNTQNNYATIAEVQIQVSSGQTENQCVDNPIKDIKTSGSQTSFPGSNVLDKDLNTRWSNYGIGSWIQLDLGTISNICSVDIAWYKGNERQNNFDISASNDSAKFSNVLGTTSSGSTIDKEKYSIDASAHLNARYVRITVNGNTQNAYASITEISIDKAPLIPILDTSKTIRMAVVGDVDNNNGFVTELNLMNKYGVQQFVLAGDYAYSNGPAVLDKAKTAGFNKSNTIIAVGNHDSCSSIKSYLANSLCYYQKTIGSLDFFVLDANSGFDCSGTQFQTITSRIQSSIAIHKVVVIHQPFVTVKSTHSPNGKFACFDAIFQSSGVDVVAQAHNHNYQLGKIGNIFYGVFGTGTHDTGSSMYGCGSNSFIDHPMKCITGTNGIEIIDFSINSNTIKGYFISNADTLIDSWSN
jgi:predicted phosphodiesterase